MAGDVEVKKCGTNSKVAKDGELVDECIQGDVPNLSGIQFEIINKSAKPVAVNPTGQENGLNNRRKCDVGAVCATITTDASGVAKTTGKALPYGSYEVKEKVFREVDGVKYANNYYLYSDTTARVLNIRADGQVKKFTSKIQQDYTAEGGDLTGDMFVDEFIRGGVKIYKCDDELRAGSNGNATANASATRTCMPIGGASFEGIKVAIWNRSAKTVVVKGQKDNTQAKKADGSAITGDYACAPSTGYDVSKACMILTFDKNHIDGSGSNGGWYVETTNKAFPVGHYEFREIDPEGRTNPQNYSNGKGYYLTDTQYTHKFSIDPLTNPSGWTQQPAANAEGQTTKVNQDGQRKIFLPKTYTNGTNDAALFNKARRGDVHFQKKIEDCADPSLNGSALKFAPFLLVSKTNGEAHVLITNKNGIAGTGMTPDLIDDDYIEQKYKYHTNENDGLLGNQLTTATSACAKAVKALTTASNADTAAARSANSKLVKAVQAACTISSANETTYLNDAHAQYRVWFGSDIRGNTAPVDNNRSGALPYDDYYLVELRTSKTTELKLQLAATTVNVEKNGQNVDLGTIDDVPECEEECEIVVDLVKDSTPAPGSIVNPGDIITYRLTYSNIGNKDITNAGIRDVVPEGTTYVDGSANLNGYYNKDQNSVDWKNLSIKAGRSIIVTFKVKVNGAASSKEEAKNASAHAAVQDCEGNTSSDGSGSGGSDDPRVIVNQALYAADWDGTKDPENESNIIKHKKNVTHGYCLTVYKESNPVSGSQVGVPGNSAGLPSEITYTLPAVNTGASVVPFTRIRDYIPEGTTYKEGSVSAGGVYNAEGNYVEWVIKDIQPNATDRSAYYTVTVKANATTGEAELDHIYNTALYESGKDDPGKPGDPNLPDPGKETNKVVHWTKTPPPCLLNGIKDATPAPGTTVHTGDVITYHLTLKNNGGQACTRAMIRDYIPENTTYVEGSADNGGSYDKDTNAVYWENLRVEPAGGTITVNFKVQVNEGVGQTSIFNQFDYGEGSLDNTSNIVEHPAPLTPLVPKTGSEKAVTLATGFSGLVGILAAALYFTKRHFTRRSFRL